MDKADQERADAFASLRNEVGAAVKALRDVQLKLHTMHLSYDADFRQRVEEAIKEANKK